MDDILFTAGLVVGGIFLTAFAVAGWEHRRREIERSRSMDGPEPWCLEPQWSAQATDAPAFAGDQAMRQWTLAQAFGRMTQTPRVIAQATWEDTEPMVGTRLAPELQPAVPADA